MMGWLALSAALLAQAAPAPKALVFAGVRTGLQFPFGVEGLAMLTDDGSPRWTVDVLWQPSAYRQSYSVGGSFQPFSHRPYARVLFAGARIRELQLAPPWSRGFISEFDNQWAIGPELGFRRLFGDAHRIVLTVGLGAIVVVSDTVSLPPSYTLDVALAYRVYGF